MSTSTSKLIVGQIQAENDTYYICNRPGGITLDTNVEYNPVILAVGDASRFGNFGEGFQIGNCTLDIVNGEEHFQGAYLYDVTQVWNNKTCVLKTCDPDNDTAWNDCDAYYSGIIKALEISTDKISFSIELDSNKDSVILPRYTVEDIVKDRTDFGDTEADRLAVIPQDMRGKRIPIQFGDLNDTASGIFAKGVTISGKVGLQEIQFDTEVLYGMSNIGCWESGSKRYFTGKKEALVDSVMEGEYIISSDYNLIQFKIDSQLMLDGDLDDTAGQASITIKDGAASPTAYTKLQWADEDSIPNWNTIPELLSPNIIAIGNELMVLIEKPASNTIWVERGFNGTTVSSHSTNDTVYQSAKYSAKNLLSFTELFAPKAIANFNSTASLSAWNYFGESTRWNYVIDGDISNYLKIISDADFDAGIKFDLKFSNISDDFTVFACFVAIKASWDIKRTNAGAAYLWVYDNSSESSDPKEVILIDKASLMVSQLSIDSYTEIDRVGFVTITDSGTSTVAFYPNIMSGTSPVTFGSLSRLNERVRLKIQVPNTYGIVYLNFFKLYAIGFWIDFFVDFTKYQILSDCRGREITTAVGSILDVAGDVGDYTRNPVTILAELLTVELGYVETDFDTESWRDVWTYFTTVAIWGSTTDDLPQCSFSWGVDDEMKGMELCQTIASHFCLSIIKQDDGRLKLVNLHKLQSTDETYGYPTLTAHKISIDDIIVSGSSRMIKLSQTGTDMLRNDVSIKYRRNNSNDEYDLVSPYTIADAFVLPESGLTLAQARTKYFNGKKTETLVIESPFIQLANAAQILAEWHIKDKAESSFWVEFTLDHEHYTLVNSLSKQYEIGDVIYFDGKYCGISLTSANKWVVREVIKKDQGREIEIHAKSIQPISEFTFA